MRKLMAAAVAASVLGGTCPGYAEEAKPEAAPEQIQNQMDAAFGMMAPMMGKMMETMLETQLTVLAKPSSADKIAQYVRNLRDALVKQGFTKDEAVKIVTSLPLPSAPLASK